MRPINLIYQYFQGQWFIIIWLLRVHIQIHGNMHASVPSPPPPPHTHMYTTNTCMHYWWRVGRQLKTEITNQYREDSLLFLFCFLTGKKRVKKNAWLWLWVWQRKEENSRPEVQCNGRISPPGFSHPSSGHGRSEHPRLSKESNKEQRWSNSDCRQETMQKRVRAILHWIQLLIGSQWRAKG